MVFALTVDSQMATLIIGNWYLATGTWTATAVTKGSIVTTLSNILFHSVHVTSGDVTSQLTEKANVDGDGAALAGSIGILVTVAGNAGTWQAIGEL